MFVGFIIPLLESVGSCWFISPYPCNISYPDDGVWVHLRWYTQHISTLAANDGLKHSDFQEVARLAAEPTATPRRMEQENGVTVIFGSGGRVARAERAEQDRTGVR